MKKDLSQFETFVTKTCKNITNHEVINSELIVTCKTSNIVDLLEDLKQKDGLNFEMLLDITAVDYPQRTKRFELVYNLLSIKNNLRIRIKIFLNDNQIVPSISKLYKCARWYEREVWDLFGGDIEARKRKH